ncbi:dihydrofolate reductase family protein [Spirillospora sp. NPDC047279]|uniref:dihydrofolate reductase family protein n=1 Tax=Spirillospora sp. NPDC047279 TaxID=3155478 RepID=UPI0033ECCEB5
MSKVTCDMGVSVDGYVAGLGQSLDTPFGEGVGDRLHEWMFQQPEENAEVITEITNAGAFIMGRNMFGPDRGDWDLDWTGWWGEEPPYHAPVFVLAHRPRESFALKGGTTFHFVTGGIEDALARAREAAGERSVSIAGGAHTVNQYMAAGLIDELRLHVAPVVLGRGERLFEGVGDVSLEQVSVQSTSLVTHVTYRPAR